MAEPAAASTDPGPGSAAPVIPNFRDAGGHPAADGARVRTGVLYRSVDLASLDEATMAWLASLGIRTVFDLRTAPERAQRASRAPEGAEVVVLDVFADATQAGPAELGLLMQDAARASAQLAGDATVRLFTRTYEDLVRLPSARAAFGTFYRRLATDGSRPALVHCTTGKDRTGWAVAALLRFLGVPADVVLADYLRSDTEIRGAFGWIIDEFVARGGERSVIDPIVGVRTAYLESAEVEVGRTFGSFEAYLVGGLGLDAATLEALRAAFLEPA